MTADAPVTEGPRRIQLLRRPGAPADPMFPPPWSGRRGYLFAFAIWLLLVGGSVSWRQKVYFDGDLDPVVLAKAVVTGLAMLLCLHARLNCSQPNPIGRRTMTLVAAFVAFATFGGWAAGDGVSAAIVAVRVLMFAAAAYLLVRSFQLDVLLWALFTAMAAVGLVAVLTGALRLGSTGGRLEGGIPPLAANEIALLCGVPALALAWKYLTHRGRGYEVPLILLLLGVVWASESRTGLAALLVAGLVMLCQARRISPAAVVAVIMGAAGVLYAALATNLVAGYFERSTEGSVDTLNSRTIAWSAALDLHQTPVAWWFGGGLALKRIPVEGQYWDTQGLDSTWFSAWVQGGIICLLLLTVIVTCALVASWRTPIPYRMLITGVLLFQVLRSFLESGMMDATPSFLLFMTMSMLAEKASRPTLAAAAAGDRAGAVPEAPHGRKRRTVPFGNCRFADESGPPALSEKEAQEAGSTARGTYSST
jgi:hypothetical protein